MKTAKQEALEQIIHVCGTVNFSSHNQMRDAIEGSLELAQEAIEKDEWIKITDQSGLPGEDISYWAFTKEGLVRQISFDHHLPSSVKYWSENITHYQPIQKPLPPIY